MGSKPAPITADQSLDKEAAWARVKGLVCQLSVDLRIPHFTVRDLLDLAPGCVLDTLHEEGSHLPVVVNGQTIAWGEFDVVDDGLAVRLMELVS